MTKQVNRNEPTMAINVGIIDAVTVTEHPNKETVLLRLGNIGIDLSPDMARGLGTALQNAADAILAAQRESFAELASRPKGMR